MSAFAIPPPDLITKPVTKPFDAIAMGAKAVILVVADSRSWQNVIRFGAGQSQRQMLGHQCKNVIYWSINDHILNHSLTFITASSALLHYLEPSSQCGPYTAIAVSSALCTPSLFFGCTLRYFMSYLSVPIPQQSWWSSK